MTITGTATKSGLTETSTFTVTLTDICDPPTRVTRAAMSNQEFTISDKTEPQYTHDVFTIEPSFCPLVYTYTAT